jgi:hypothetical protein
MRVPSDEDEYDILGFELGGLPGWLTSPVDRDAVDEEDAIPNTRRVGE